jgi:hypothetical protein
MQRAEHLQALPTKAVDHQVIGTIWWWVLLTFVLIACRKCLKYEFKFMRVKLDFASHSNVYKFFKK